MEPFRVRQKPSSADDSQPSKPKLLLALSFGACSTTLLSLLDNQLESQQARTSRTAYDVLVVHVDHSCLDPSLPSAKEQLELLRTSYPRFEYRIVQLEEELGFRRLGVVGG